VGRVTPRALPDLTRGDLVTKLSSLITREPVVFFGAVLATFEAAFPDVSPAVKLAAAGWCTWLQRMFSTPKAKADTAVEVAKYVGAVEHQAVVSAGAALNAPSQPERPLRAR
jgi:hypothetical protein